MSTRATKTSIENSIKNSIESSIQNSMKTRQRIRPETRAELLERLTNPEISLHEVSTLLKKCPATVRNYCNAGWLLHHRTEGNQRRFYFKDVMAFLRAQEAERKK